MLRITFIRKLIAIVTINKLEICQMYVKTTFLNGDLEDEVYMEQPEGFIKKKVCKLVKLFYSLKQILEQ
jgi:hypothetical protein